MKRSLISLVVTEMQIKTAVWYHFDTRKHGARMEVWREQGHGVVPPPHKPLGGVHVGTAPFWFASFLGLFVYLVCWYNHLGKLDI